MPYLFIMQLKICYEIHMRKNTTAYVNSLIDTENSLKYDR